MAADGQRFDERTLLRREARCGMQFARGDRELRPQTAVAMHTQRLVMFAAISQASAAGITLLAIEVRLDGTLVARAYVRHPVTNGNDLDTKLVARDAGIGKKRHLSQV